MSATARRKGHTKRCCFLRPASAVLAILHFPDFFGMYAVRLPFPLLDMDLHFFLVIFHAMLNLSTRTTWMHLLSNHHRGAIYEVPGIIAQIATCGDIRREVLLPAWRPRYFVALRSTFISYTAKKSLAFE